NYAIALRTYGKLDGAVALLEPLVTEMEQSGFRDQRAPAIVYSLIESHERLKQFDKAETWQRKWLAFVKKQSGSDSTSYATELRALGWNLLQQHKWEEADPILREYLTVCERKTPNTWMRFEAVSLVGGALLGQKKYADAEPLLLEGYEGMKRREMTMP